MKLLEINLYTNDLAGTRAFYSRELSLPIVSESPLHLSFQVGWTRLTFYSVNLPIAPYHFGINVPYSLLEECTYYFAFDYLQLQAPGQIIAEFPVFRTRACYFYDNNGNLIKFVSRADLPLDDPNLTLADLFQGICELGISTLNVAQTTSQLLQQFGIRQHPNAKPSPDLNMLGDDNGLFIVSRLNSSWPFTQVKAKLSYSYTVFHTDTNARLQVINSHELYKPQQEDIRLHQSIESILS
ncbi:VOC family protein [Fibrisoma limi]|nr:VOC family protein [Fibrisoma limi]